MMQHLSLSSRYAADEDCDLQADYPLSYWPGVIVFDSIYAIFESRRWSNFQKYKEVCQTPSKRLKKNKDGCNMGIVPLKSCVMSLAAGQCDLCCLI